MWHIDSQVAVIVFLITFAIGRLLARRAVAHLDSAQKVQLVDSMGLQRVVTPVILLVLVGIYFLALKRWSESAATLQAGFSGAALVLVVAAMVSAQRRIRRLGLPPTYLRLISISQAVQFIGAALLLGTLAAG